MARIVTSNNLVGAKITLIDGTVSKITKAIATGYNVEGEAKRISARCIIKAGKGFKQIEKPAASAFEDTGEGYVRLLKQGETPAPKAPKTPKTPKTPKAGGVKPKAEPVKKSGKTVSLSAVSAALGEHLRKTALKAWEQLVLVDENGDSIDNPFSVESSCEYSDVNGVAQVNLRVTYDLVEEVEEDEGSEYAEHCAAFVKRAAKHVAKETKANLRKVAKALGEDVIFGETIIVNDEDQKFVLLGVMAKTPTKVLIGELDGDDKMRGILMTRLSDYTLFVEEEEVEDDEIIEDDEIVEDDDLIDEGDDLEDDTFDFDVDSETDEEGDELEDGDDFEFEDSNEEGSEEYVFRTLTKDQLATADKSKRKAAATQLAKMMGVDASDIGEGIELICEEDNHTLIFVGGGKVKNSLIFVDGDDGEILSYSSKAQLAELSEYGLSVDGDQFDMGEDAAEGFDDLTDDELRAQLISMKLATKKAVAKMDREEMLEMLDEE